MVHNRTGADSVVEIARTSAPESPLSVVYLRADDKVLLTGFGTGIYDATGSFGQEWDVRRKQFLKQRSPAVSLGSFYFAEFESANGKHCNSYEIIVRPNTSTTSALQ
jgi:hypothetical protein